MASHGKIAEATTLPRKTAAEILKGLNREKRTMFSLNPEKFILDVSEEIDRQRVAVVAGHILYQPSAEEPCTQDTFNMGKAPQEYAKAYRTRKAVQDRVFTDGTAADGVGRRFAESADAAEEVAVCAKLPSGSRRCDKGNRM